MFCEQDNFCANFSCKVKSFTLLFFCRKLSSLRLKCSFLYETGVVAKFVFYNVSLYLLTLFLLPLLYLPDVVLLLFKL
jgi:hypothetical protein